MTEADACTDAAAAAHDRTYDRTYDRSCCCYMDALHLINTLEFGRRIWRLEIALTSLQKPLTFSNDLAASTAERLDEYHEYPACKQYRCPGADIADYESEVTQTFMAYVHSNARRTHMWLYAVQAAIEALGCFVSEKILQRNLSNNYYERMYMAEQIFDEVICGIYGDEQRYEVFLQDLPVKSIFAAYTSDPCHAAAKERIVIHVIAVHVFRRHYRNPR